MLNSHGNSPVERTIIPLHSTGFITTTPNAVISDPNPLQQQSAHTTDIVYSSSHAQPVHKQNTSSKALVPSRKNDIQKWQPWALSEQQVQEIQLKEEFHPTALEVP